MVRAVRPRRVLMPSLRCKSLSVVSLWTDRMPETVHFYREVLGLKECTCHGYHMDPVHFEVGDSFLVLLKGKMAPETDSERFPLLAITVENLEDAAEALRYHGVELVMGIQEDESSHWTFCRDPGGNFIEIAVWK